MANQLSFSITARNSASTAMNALQKQVSSLKNGLASLNNNTNATNAYLNSLNRNASSSNTIFGSLGRTVKSTLGIFGGFKLVNSLINLFTNNIGRAIERADTMDLFNQKMTLITRDANTATQALDELTKATKNTPYALDVAAKGVQNFVLRGQSAGEAVDSVKIWMDAVSTYGKGTNEQFESVMDAIAKMRTKGTVEMRYLNRLFAAGINPVQMYATATGQSAQAVQEALSNKDISAKDFLDTVEKAMREGTNGVLQIQGNAKRLATTWAATTANMSIAIARGILKVVDGLDQIALLFNEKGLKGIVADFGSSTENILTAVGDTIGGTVGGFKRIYEQLRSENERTFSAVDQRVALSSKYMAENYSDAGKQFTGGFFNVLNPQLATIVGKFLNLRDTWSSVGLAFSKGIKQISDPLGRLLGTYLGATITSVEDLGIAFGNWLNLKLPVFFEKLENVLNWLIDHKDGVVTAVKAMIKAMLGLGILQTLQGVLVGFNDKLKALNNTLAFFTMGKIQIPTMENLVTNKKDTENKSNKKNKVSQAPTVKPGSTLKNTALGQWIANSFTNTKSKYGGKVTGAVDYVKDSTKAVVSGTPHFFDVATQELNDGLERAGLGFTNFFRNTFGGHGGLSFLEQFQQDMQDTKRVTTSTGKGIKNTFTNFFGTMFSGFKGFNKSDSIPKTGGTNFLKRGWDWLNTDAQGNKTFTVQKFKNAGQAVGGGVSKVGRGVGDFFGTMFGGFGNLGKGMNAKVALDGTEEVAQQSGTLTKILDNLKGAFVSVGSGIKTVVGWITSFITTTAGVATAVVLATAAIGGLAAGLGVFNPGNAVSDAINSFFDNFFNWCTTFAQNAPILIQNFVTGLIQNLPKLVSQGVNLVLSIVNGIMTGIPKILTVGASLLFSLISGILQVLPELVYQGFNAIGQFIAGIIENLPNVLSAGWELVKTILKGILTNLPLLIASGVQLIINLVKGIWSMVSQVWNAITGLIVDAVTYVWNHPQEIWDAITGLCGELWNALLSGLYAAADMFNAGWILDALGAQRPDIEKGGAETAQSAIDGANNQLQSSGLDLQSAIQQANVDQANQQASSAGQQIGQNVTAGIDQELANTSLEAGQVGVDTGTNYVDGVAQGVTDSAEGVDTALSSVGSEGMAQLTVNFNGEQVQQAAGGLIDTLTAIINERSLDVAMAMASMANNSMVQLAASFQALPEDIPNAISVAMTSVVDTVNAKVQEICNNIRTNLTNAKTEADTATQQLSEAIQNNFANATISVNASLEQMKTDVYTRYEELRSGVTEKLGAIESAQTVFSTDHMSTFQSNMSTYEDNILLDYQVFCDGLKGKMDDLVKHSAQTGKDMMSQMASGIDTNMSLVTDKANELVKKLKETFEKGLGIASPSRYMIYIGQMVLAGLMKGMSQEKIKKFVEATIGDMRTSFKNGKFNADEMVDYLGKDSSMNVVKYLELIGDQTVNDLFGDGGTPAIVQEALKYVGYAPGGYNSMFGLHYGNPDAWCVSFVRYCAEQTGVPFPATNYVPDVLNWSIATGRYTQTPQPGYAAIFGGGSHIELVAGVSPDGTVDMVGGNTGMGEVKHRPRNDATSYVALDGGHSTMTLKDYILQAYNKKYNPLALMASSGSYDVSAGASQWADYVLQALAMLGQPASLLGDVLYAIDRESSGNPNAINLGDSNAWAGHPSQGLLQTIPSTFAAYRNPNLANSLTDPLANIYAGLNYMIQRYGGIHEVVEPRRNSEWGWYGYAVGTRYVPNDMLAMIHQGEAIIPASQNPYSNSGGDYLGDLVNSAFENNKLNNLGFDLNSMTGSSDDNRTTNNNLNNVFNITNSSDVDSDRSISEMEQMLHRLLQDGRRVGVPR